MLRFLFIYISLLTSTSFADEPTKVFVDTSYKNSEEIGLQYYVDNFISINSFARPFDQKELKQKMKEWNPQIKSWKKVNYGETIRIRQKTSIIDVFAGYHFATNKEDLPSDNEIQIDSQENYFGTSYYHFLGPSIFISGELALHQQWSFTSIEADQTYDYSPTLSFSSHFNYLTKKNWGAGIGLERERIQFLSVENIENQSETGILRRLKIADASIYWTQLKLTYRTTRNDKGSYYTSTFSKSFAGTKTFPDSGDESSLKGIKLSLDWKQYWYKNYWSKITYDFRAFDSTVEYSRSSLGFQIGHTFW